MVLPNHKSTKKRLRTSIKSNLSNRGNRAQMRTALRAYRKQAPKAEVEEKLKQLPHLYSLVDSQARKGIIPKQRASRIKSRLAALARS